MNKLNPFDKRIKDQLGRVRPIMPEHHWDRFAQELDEELVSDATRKPLSDAELDQIIADRLQHYTPRKYAAQWAHMEMLLDRSAKVFHYKLAEASILLLLFWFCWQTPPPSAYHQNTTPSPVGTPLADAQAGMLPSVSVGEAVGEEVFGGLHEATVPVGDNYQAPSSDSPTDASSPYGQQPRSAEVNSAPAGTEPPVDVVTRKTSLATVPLRRAIPSLPITPAQRASITMPPVTVGKVVYSEAMTNIPTLATEVSQDKDHTAPASMALKPNKSQPVLRVGMFASGDYNRILISPNANTGIFDVETINRVALGYGGGLSLGLDMGRWEVETGAIYASRKYPVGLIYVEGGLREGLKGSELRAAELNMINIPLHVRYNVLLRGPWRAYVLAGASIQLTFQADYFAVNADDQYNTKPSRTPSGAGQEKEEESSIVRIQKESIGLFEGGSFNDNTYLTGNIGLGVERYVGNRWSLFAQPTYQHALHYFGEGLGPNKDHINSLSVFFGAKVRL